MSYCHFFQTLYDETHPVGNLGRGTHYSVLRAPVWHDELLNRIARCAFLDFAVIWDEACNYPQFASSKPSWISTRRRKPRQMTELPGGGSLARAR